MNNLANKIRILSKNCYFYMLCAVVVMFVSENDFSKNINMRMNVYYVEGS